jgi:hypothetical protein
MTQEDLFMSKLHPKQREMIIKTTTLLSGMGCKYYIKTPDGEVFSLGLKTAGSDNNPKVVKTKAESKFKHGERTAYVRPFIEQIKEVGQIVSVPPGVGMTLKEVLSIVSSTAHGELGKGMYQAEVDEANNCVTVMNTGGIRV